MTRTLRLLGALAISLAGTALVFQTLDWINSAPPAKKEQAARKQVAFKVDKKRKRKVTRRARPKPRPQPRPRRARAPMPQLSTALSGIRFDLPALSTDALSGAQDKLLGSDAALKDVVMTASSVDSPPKPSAPVSPSYPARARAQGVQGYVKFKLLVDADGGVVEVRVVDSKPRGVFDDAATAAIRRWRFTPATYRGKAVKLWVTQTLRFKLG
jgi:protein TonB